MADEVQCAECSRPVGDRLTLCTHCGDRLRAELLSVPGVLADLTTMRSGQARFTSQRVGSRGAEVALPVQSIARDRHESQPQDPVGAELRGDRGYTRLETAVTGWARVLGEHLGEDIPIGARGLQQLAVNGRTQPADHTAVPVRDAQGKFVRVARRHPDALTSPATPIEQAAVWMACYPHQLRAHEAAGEMLAEITDALTELRRIVDRPAELRYLGPCPGQLHDGVPCEFGLRAEPGETWVRCGRCNTQHSVPDLQAKARGIAEDQLYTLFEMRSVLAAVGTVVSKQTLHWWANGRKENRLEPRGWQHADGGRVRITDHQISERDRQVYRLGDALALAARDEKQGGSAA